MARFWGLGFALSGQCPRQQCPAQRRDLAGGTFGPGPCWSQGIPSPMVSLVLFRVKWYSVGAAIGGVAFWDRLHANGPSSRQSLEVQPVLMLKCAVVWRFRVQGCKSGYPKGFGDSRGIGFGSRGCCLALLHVLHRCSLVRCSLPAPRDATGLSADLFSAHADGDRRSGHDGFPLGVRCRKVLDETPSLGAFSHRPKPVGIRRRHARTWL